MVESSATSSSATSLYVVIPLDLTFWQTLSEKWRRPLLPLSVAGAVRDVAGRFFALLEKK